MIARFTKRARGIRGAIVIRESVPRSTIAVACVGFMFSASSQMRAQRSRWPIIQPIEVTRSYDHSTLQVNDTPLRVILRDLAAKPVYRLECHNGDYDVDSEYTYSGDFHCMLFALKGNARASWNLLATSSEAEQGSDWLNRGRMTAGQLNGACADVPDYGRSRRFYLRHMLLTIDFTNARWRVQTQSTKRKLARFTVRVRASSDPSAETDVAAPATPPALSSSCGFSPGE